MEIERVADVLMRARQLFDWWAGSGPGHDHPEPSLRWRGTANVRKQSSSQRHINI